jgi:1-acyl-sn-glycerol-3-phosphate acyltransferase
LRRALGRFVLRIAGWTIDGDVPAEPRFVAIVAPHTSNWDFVIGVAGMFALDLRVRWLGKHTLFWWPLGWFLRALGGWPVRRDSPQGVVAEVADAIRAQPRFILALAPEGTRRRVDEWRTGFYRIAERAGVPIVPVALDWGRRVIAIGEPVHATGDASCDIERLRARYHADMALRPELFVALRNAEQFLPPNDTENGGH